MVYGRRYSRYSRARGMARRRYGRARARYGRRPRASIRALANLRTGGRLAVELKNYDTSSSASGAATTPAVVALGTDVAASVIHNTALTPVTGSVYWLNCPKVGSDSTNRDGRVITNRSIEIQGSVGLEFTAAFDLNVMIVNIALVLDTQANGASPAGTGGNVFQLATANDYVASAPFRNLDNSVRYRVLAHKRVTPKPYIGDSGAFSARSQFRIYRRLGFKTNFTASSTDPSSEAIVDNGLFLMAWADHLPTGTPGIAPYIGYTSRLRFVG